MTATITRGRFGGPLLPCEVWVSTQSPEDHGNDEWWMQRAFGRYFGYPDCCIEAFTARGTARSEPPLVLYGDRGHVMCPACIADPERADRRAAEGRARRVAAADHEAVR